ncbi:hypothetical protein BUALT_Bualt19G0026500 [Buddleja alternifolia]|uniref:RING-type domain-containing protein n=1 Tax=Buddleja alternifolia TaxID=168488 RepID=A0AAV6W4V1_9LAMI|nr:hypothetical protein BUALT_Bualt19G0026500 [Buddleja alternifolia]
MGSSSSSHIQVSSSNSSSPSGIGRSRFNRAKRKLSSLFCAASSSKSTLELEDFPEKSSVSCTENLTQTDGSRNSIIESSSVFTLEVEDTSSTRENEDSSRRNSSIIEEASLESNLLNMQTSRNLEPLPRQPAHESITGNTTLHDQSTNGAQGPTISLADAYDHEYLQNSIVANDYSDLRSFSIASDSLPRFQLPGDNHAHGTTTSSPGFLVSDSNQDWTSGDLLHIDVVSISSNILSSEVGNRESRRNSRRLFWDALSRRSFRRHSDTPSIVLATGLSDDLGSSHDRWLLDLSGDLHYNGAGSDLDSLGGARRNRGNERRRWLLRSEISERNLGGFSEGGQQTAFCASGLHPDGTCSCDSFFTAEEYRSLASISRIITLAETLFEVLDEIHHQTLSLSLSTLSLPAPESVVDAFPLKYHKNIEKPEKSSSDVQQCYICLADYEDGDKLRVLPCNHEFHVPCIDKWLKEVNRVCPLCRHNVCEDPGECSVSNTNVS